MENLSIIIWGIKTSKLLTLSPCLVYGTMYMFPIPGTHFTSNMHYPSREIHITSEMCSPTTRIKAICVSQVGKTHHQGYFVSWEGEETPLVMSVPLLGKHTSLVKCVPLPGKRDICFPGRRTHITVSFVGETHFTKDGGTHITVT